jgi:hypothetical protein
MSPCRRGRRNDGAPEGAQECAAGDDPVNIGVALQIVLQGERVPYR